MSKFKEKDLFDSPYKNCLSEIKCVDTNNEDDFRTPKYTKKISKTIKKQVKKKPKCKSQRIDTIFRKAQSSINDSDVNPDHIQMAIALSKSTLDQENPEESKRVNAEDCQHTFGQSYDQKLGNMLERYGFKSTRSSCKPGMVLNPEKVFQRKRYPGFKYSLLSTTKEDRDVLIEKKISAILTHFQTNKENGTIEFNIFSDLLKKYHVKQSKLVKVQSFNINEDVPGYYTMNLNLPRTNSSCGCLLKDWKVIPGRELSPIRGDQNPDDLLSKNLRTSRLENTNSSESLERSTDSSRNKTNELEQTSSYKTHEENNSSTSTNRCTMKEVKENKDLVNIKEKNIEMDVDSIESQTGVLNSDSPNSSSALKTIAEMKKHDSTCYNQQSDISIENQKSASGLRKYDQSFSNNQKLSESITEEENKKSSDPRVYCCSPDLFSSDDDGDFRNFDKHTTFQASLETNSDQKGIEYFESFSADSCTLSQEMYKSSNSEQYNNVSQEKVGLALMNNDQSLSDKVIIVLDSDEDSMIVGNVENKESERTKGDHIGANYSQHESSSEDDSKSYIKKELSNENIVDHSCNRSKLYTNDNGSHSKIKPTFTDLVSKSNEAKNRDNMANHTMQNQELDMKDQRLESKRQNSMSPINCISNNLAADIDFDIPRCSTSSKVYSPSFNSNSKLNVTDYIENMLGEDYAANEDLDDGQNDKEISLSQSSSDSIIISDEELNCTKIQHSTTKAYCDYNGVDDGYQNIREETENVEDIKSKIDKISNYETPKKSVTFSDSLDRLLQNSKILDGLDNIACESKVVQNENRSKQDTVPVTPKNKLIIKTRDVTPMPDYDQMSSAEIVKELKKFRVKPLKRQRGITMLKYIYECTHPMIPTDDKYADEEEENRIFKKRRKDISEGSFNKDNGTGMKFEDIVCKNEIIEWYFNDNSYHFSEKPEDLIFERKFRAKMAYCRIPLQIVWYNFVQSNPELRKNILLYEPLHLNSVYAMLKEQSNCKFHVEVSQLFILSIFITLGPKV
nr:unnamed protein product [Callosobruchus chinensis]